jgi:hypothetical protein
MHGSMRLRGLPDPPSHLCAGLLTYLYVLGGRAPPVSNLRFVWHAMRRIYLVAIWARERDESTLRLDLRVAVKDPRLCQTRG